MLTKAIAKLAGASLAAIMQLCAASIFDPNDYAPEHVMHRDVCIIGGGSSGVYTAVHLGDYGKSVVVVEEKDRLGGHAQTYVDPATGNPINIGVVVFDNTTVVKSYFARFDVPLTSLSSSGGPAEYIDFTTGKVFRYMPNQESLSAAFAAYATQLAKYPGLQTGFNLTYPVHPDLLLPFGEFVEKYDLGAFMPLIFVTFQGFSPVLKLSTLYMLKYFNSAVLEDFTSAYLTTAHHDTGEIYERITTYLGRNVLLGTSVLAMDRSSELDVKVLVSTPSGRKLIIAKKLVSAVPPNLHNLRGYDLSSDEKTLFGKFFFNGYYAGILKNTGFVENVSFVSFDPSQPYDTPRLPGVYTLAGAPSTNLTQVWFGSPHPLPVEQVKADIIATVKRVQISQGTKVQGKPEFVAFSSHTPFNLMVHNDEIEDGFYEKLYALQGQRNTFYNGAAWQTQSSSVLWQFTQDYLLPRILDAL